MTVQVCHTDDVDVADHHFDPDRRRDGISGFMRLKNEEEYLDQVIESLLPFLDELVIVYNECTDRTPEIVARCQARHPQKVKVYHYVPRVYPQRSDLHTATSPVSVHSLVRYCNFALSRTTCRYAVKVDGDEVAIPGAFKFVTEMVRSKQPTAYLSFQGINLTRKGNAIGVPRAQPFCGLLGDAGVFRVGRNTRFLHHEYYERLAHGLPIVQCGIAFFHIKGLTSDRGMNKYDLKENPHSPHWGPLKQLWGVYPETLTWDQFKDTYHVPDYVPDPASLGLDAMPELV